MQDIAVVQAIAQTMYDKKGRDIIALDVSNLTVVCNYMVICSARNSLLTTAIADEIEDKMDEMDVKMHRCEGVNEGRWIILDYGHILVHVFHQEERAYYNLERLWEDGNNRLVLPFDQSEDA